MRYLCGLIILTALSGCYPYTWVPVVAPTSEAEARAKKQEALDTRAYCERLGHDYASAAHGGPSYSSGNINVDFAFAKGTHSGSCMRSRGFEIKGADNWEEPLVKIVKDESRGIAKAELNSWEWMGVTRKSEISYSFSAMKSQKEEIENPIISWRISAVSNTWAYLKHHDVSIVSDGKKISLVKPAEHRKSSVFDSGRVFELILVNMRMKEFAKMATGDVVRFKINRDVFEIPGYYQPYMRRFLDGVREHIAVQQRDPFSDLDSHTGNSSKGHEPVKNEEDAINEALGL